MSKYLCGLALVAVLLSSPFGVRGAGAAAGSKVIVYGGDLAPAERQELAQLFGQDAAAKTDTVTAPEIIAAEQGTGLPAAPTDKAISSAALTCRDKGQGLRVRTQNITRITAATYANALVTAGIGDGDVLIAAPATNPVTGESGLVGALKAFPQCQAGAAPDPNRVRLAYNQLAATIALAGSTGDVGTASNVVLKAAQAVITGKAADEATVGTALDQAATGEGLTLDPAARTQAITTLKGLAGADYGTYAQGYRIQQASPTEVNVTPVGAGAPSTAVAATFSGSVTKAGTPLGVRATTGQERTVTGGPGLTVIRDGKPATIADLRAGDLVNVTADPAGVATRIEASSAPAAAVPATRSATGGAAPAAVPATRSATGGAAPATGTTVTGEATNAGVAGTPLTARVDGQDRSFTPASNVAVTRDGKDAALGDIKVGDTVVVTTNPEGTATRIAATSKLNPLGFLRWLLPVLLLLALLGLLLFFLARRRRRDSFILEPTTTATVATEQGATTTTTTTVERDPQDRPRRS